MQEAALPHLTTGTWLQEELNVLVNCYYWPAEINIFTAVKWYKRKDPLTLFVFHEDPESTFLDQPNNLKPSPASWDLISVVVVILHDNGVAMLQTDWIYSETAAAKPPRSALGIFSFFFFSSVLTIDFSDKMSLIIWKERVRWSLMLVIITCIYRFGHFIS